jgi:hypothetical protein
MNNKIAKIVYNFVHYYATYYKIKASGPLKLNRYMPTLFMALVLPPS